MDYKVVGRYTYSSRYGGRSTTLLKAPIIAFNYNGTDYKIIGGSDQNRDPFEDVKVVFSRSSPENALEYSLEGFLDFPILHICALFWLFVSAILYGVVNLDRHFSLFDFNVKKFSIKWALIITIPFLLFPLIPHAKLLLFAVKTYGIVSNEPVSDELGSSPMSIAYTVDSRQYRIAINDYDYEEKNMFGLSAPVIYDITNPANASLNTFHSLYINNWLVVTGMGLVFLSGWFFATRMPNDEGTMDE